MVALDLHGGSADAAAKAAAFVRIRKDGAKELELSVRGAHCAACLKRIEGGVGALSGVEAARMNLSTGKFAARWRGPLEARVIVERLGTMGFEAKPFDARDAARATDEEETLLLWCMAVAGIASLSIMHLTVWVWAGLSAGDMGPDTRTAMYWLSALIAIPAVLYSGRPFYRSAIASLRAGRANMDVPISLAVLLALGVSVQETILKGEHAYYDAAVMLLALLLIGRYLDHRLRNKARAAARELLALSGGTAQRLDTATGVVTLVKASEIAPGDRIVLMPGERAPVDGAIVEGITTLDRALVTGESKPVPAAAGEKLYSGVVNLSARIVMEARAKADDSLLADLTRLVEQGQQSRARFVRLADMVTAWYVPVVHGLALLTFLLWAFVLGGGIRDAILAAAALLIITCPCALGLAVPAVQIVATGRLFKAGVLVKSGDALERLAQADHAVFDKTGTLTLGRPMLVNGDTLTPETIEAAAKLARASRHPLSQAIAWAAGAGQAAADAVETPGEGITGTVNGKPARLGKAAFAGADSSPGDTTEIWFRLGDARPLRFVFADRLRPDAAETIRGLKDRGIPSEMLSGDTRTAAAEMAAQAGLTRFEAGLKPQQKIARLDALKAQKLRTLMIGDGLNDAGALASAHVSVSPGTAADAAQSASDLVIQGDTLAPLLLAVDVARRANRLVVQNFWMAALYNALAVPLAMAGLVTPLIAAAAMSASSIVVTANALRLAGR